MRVLKHLIVAWLIVCAASVAVAQDRPRVIAVNAPLQYFAERLLGEEADVIFPVPADTDPSFWRPSIADISMIQAADLILLNGAGFASWVDRVSLPRAKVVNTSAGIEDQFITTESITHSHGDGGEHSHEGVASYTWLDPMLALAQAEAVAAAITARGLASAENVETRLEALRIDLEALDADAALKLEGLGEVAMIATHPRYQYFARRYGLSLASLEWEAGAMPDESGLADLSALAESTGATVLIWEAEPPADAFEKTRALGLANVVFAPLVHASADKDFIEAFTEAIESMATRP